MPFDPELLRQLACPACRGSLAMGSQQAAIACQSCDRRYPIVDGIPVLIAERAIPKPPA